MSKQILDSEASKKQALEAVEALAGIVKQTLGPGGNPIIIQRTGQNPDGTPQGPLITKDGVTVAEHVDFKDHAKSTIAKAVLQVAKNTVNQAGDGPQPLHSKVLTPTGFVQLGELQVGDKICGTNGSIQEVVGVFPKGKRQVFEVEIANKGVVECCEDHLWTVSTHYGSVSTKTTKELLKDYLNKREDESARYKYYTPKVEVEFLEDSAKLPIDPYTLGVLLGDGSFRDSGSIEVSLGFSKEHVIDKLRVPKGISKNIQKVDSKNYYRVKFSGTDDFGRSMRDLLELVGLRNASSGSKFIPKSYLYSSTSSRKALLQGLIDTDGYRNVRGRFEFSTISSMLASDFLELNSSLGININSRVVEREVEKGAFSNTTVYRLTELKGYNFGDKLIRITPTNKFEEMRCIKVSNPDSLYITDNYIATHNTTTAIVLAEAIYKAGYAHISRGMNGIQLYSELKQLKDMIIRAIDEIKVPVKLDDVYNVAKISANGDEEIAKIVADALSQVGEDGHVSVEDANSRYNELDVVQGSVYKKGWKSFGPFGNHFVTDKIKDACQLEKPAILLYNGKLSELHDLAKLLMSVMQVDPQTGQVANPVPFFIVATDFSEDVKQMILANRVQVKLPICAIKAPFDGSPNAITEILEDIAVLTGATVFSKGIKELKDGTADDLGSCDKVDVGAEETVIFKGAGSEEEILARVEDLKKSLDVKQYEFDQENLRIRIGKLIGGIAIIRAGGDSELEMLEKKDRIEDALCAARVAIQDGVLPGGGSALYWISKQLFAAQSSNVAAKIMQEALQAPIKQIITNAGENPEVVLHELYKLGSEMGYDARRKIFVNLIEEGIIDPSKVTKSALENAVSIAGLLLTTGGAIVLAPSSTQGQPNPLAGLLGQG